MTSAKIVRMMKLVSLASSTIGRHSAMISNKIAMKTVAHAGVPVLGLITPNILGA